MRHIFELTIPAATAAVSPEELEIILVKGALTQVEIAFPPGCANLVHVVIKSELFQISPVNPDGTHHWDNYTEVFNLNYPLTDKAHKLRLVGWSPGTYFPHTITFRLDVTPSAKDDKTAIQQFISYLSRVPVEV